MHAKDIMTRAVISVKPDASVRDAASLLLDKRVSALPVIDDAGKLLGIISEGDLMHRQESGTTRRRSWWLMLVSSPQERAMDYIREHSRKVADVMSRKVVTIEEDTPLEEIADLIEKNRIKRVPVMRDGRVVGIVSRADLLRGLIARREAPVQADDQTIRAAVEKELETLGVLDHFVSVVVSGGVVHLWGEVSSQAEKDAARVAAETVDGVRGVRDEIGILPPSVQSVMWAE